MEHLAQVGERALLGRLAQVIQSDQAFRDDCALVAGGGEHELLLTCDSLIEGTHFKAAWSSAEDVGIKVIEVNVSDIAAMGGRPLYALLSLAAPPDLPVDWTLQLAAAMQSAAERYQIEIVGGDTCRIDGPIALCVTLVGQIRRGRSVLRSGAREGDALAVTGFLGDAAAGLRLLQEGLTSSPLISKQRRPRAHLVEGQFLADNPAVHAMIDLSDGLFLGTRELSRASQVGAQLELAWLPLSQELSRACQRWGVDPAEFALVGGEDYCLLAAIDPMRFEAVAAAFKQRLGSSLTPVGKICGGREEVLVQKKGVKHGVQFEAFNHFRAGD